MVAGREARPKLSQVDFSRTPFTIAWEITRSCGLACLHCRAEAQPKRDPRELSTAEGVALIDEIAQMGNPILVVTGGDPLMRRDVFHLIRYATEKGLRVSFSPSATALLTRENLSRAKEAGIVRVHLSLDGSTPEIHDFFRGASGSYARTISAIKHIRELGLSLQIGTTVSRHNVADLPELSEVVKGFGALMWSLFFLVPVGRGKSGDVVSAEEHERVFNWLYDLSKDASFDVRTTAAQHYRRVVIQRRRSEEAAQTHAKGVVRFALAGAGYSFQDGIGRPERGVNDGNGFCFVSHTGDVCPSGFLQMPAGNVREAPLSDIYRNSRLFRELRHPGLLKGKCGRCEYRVVCGGSRARAYAVTGDYLESEPYCVYEPSAQGSEVIA
ncbi:MAG: TIGR04053 family radical SAM/SPASM domain-containing protein [Chloroflexi bacterium]|nr:TIGR04053 family radical SAM/SPASM domain-containing protein [Chloroflexota bacterium]